MQILRCFFTFFRLCKPHFHEHVWNFGLNEYLSDGVKTEVLIEGHGLRLGVKTERLRIAGTSLVDDLNH